MGAMRGAEKLTNEYKPNTEPTLAVKTYIKIRLSVTELKKNL